MRVRLFSLLIMSTVGSAAASAKDVTSDQLCKAVYDQALFFMLSRQVEVPITEVMKQVTPDRPHARAMVIDAYGRPAYSTAQRRGEAGRAFANEWATKCYAGILGE